MTTKTELCKENFASILIQNHNHPRKNELSEQGVLNQDSKIDFLKDIKQESNVISDSEMFENNLIVDCMESEKIRTLENIIQWDEQIWKNTLHMEEKRIEKLYKELNYEIKNNIKWQKELNQLKRQTKGLNHNNNMHIVGNDNSGSNLHSIRDHKHIPESANHPDTKNEENKQSKKQKHKKNKNKINKNNIVKMKEQSFSEENEVDEDDEEEKEKEMASNKYFRFYGFIQAFQNKLKPNLKLLNLF